MKTVAIYTTEACSYCVRAKRLLADEGVPYVEHDVTNDDERRTWLWHTTGRRTVPQIFFGDEAIGGFDELAAIKKAGQLKERLAGPPSSPA